MAMRTCPHVGLIFIIAALFVVYSGYRISAITNPFGASISLGYLAIPVTVLWIVGITNAMNLIDGLDGLAAGLSIIVCFTLLQGRILGFGRTD